MQPKITLKELSSFLPTIFDAGLVPLIESSPGIGKSSVMRKYAEDNNLHFIDIRLAHCKPEDLNGLPAFIQTADGKKRATYVTFDNFPIEGTELPEGKKGTLLFLDEITAAPKAIHVAAYQLVLDRTVGNKKLRKDTIIAAAGNLKSDNAHVNNLGTALRSRMVCLEVQADKDAFTKYMYSINGDHRVLSFLEYKPDLLHKMDATTTTSFPCPRTWEFVSKLIKDKSVSVNTHLAIIAGTIGVAAAEEFIGFCEIHKDIPSIEEICNTPETARVPTDASARFALIGYLVDNYNLEREEAMVKYAKRLPADLIAVFARNIFMKDKPLYINSKILQSEFKDLLRKIREAETE